MKVLSVAEKPSISKSISQLLSQNSATSPVEVVVEPAQRRGKNKYCMNYQFDCIFRGQQCNMVMTSVLGHLMSLDFTENYRKWHSCDPLDLFDAQLERSVSKEHGDVAKNLEIEAKYAQHLIIWTDCDREGENIGAEIVEACRRSNRHIQVWRARFSVVQFREIMHALNNLVPLDQKQADAVDARIELDLRIGAAFTRFQTLTFQSKFPELDGKIISYGPCQFPTLGFIVEQYWKRENFVSETFWGIDVTINKKGQDVKFIWKRGHLFDRLGCLILYEQCVSNPLARFVHADSKPTSKWKPLPLTTVELQKTASIFLRMPSDKTMKIAEDLYNRGLLSYPRTETDEFEKGFNLTDLIQLQTNDQRWGALAENLHSGDGFQWPRKGKHNDHAHPPIHPTKAAPELTGDEKKLYELVTRRFLACCSKDAKGFATDITINISDELFSAHGLQVTERNYLDVYTYDKWSDHIMPDFRVGEEIMPSACRMTEGRTSPPTLLSEASLIATMDANGIGTDATIAEHIKKILEREYAFKEGAFFVPSTLGLALVEGYDKISFEQSLAKPNLRKAMEQQMNEICHGTNSKLRVVSEGIRMYREMFVKAKQLAHIIEETMVRYFNTETGEDARPAGNNNNHGRRGHASNAGQGPSPRFSDEDDDDDGTNERGDMPSLANPSIHSASPEKENGLDLKCYCNEPSTKRKVMKDGPNKGRMFLSCSSRSCDFFEWTDEGPSSAPLKQPKKSFKKSSNFSRGGSSSRGRTQKRGRK